LLIDTEATNQTRCRPYLTTYVLSTLEADAERTVKEMEIMELSERDQLAFANALINPPSPNENLLSAAKRYKERMEK